MKLDRNINDDGGGKYAIVNMRKLRDLYAQHALNAYGEAAEIAGDDEYAAEIWEMAHRAGPSSPFCKNPD